MAGRPREFDVERVLDAAVELFWRGGFEATTTRAVAEETGLSASSLYNAFGSKEALLERAMERYERQITDGFLGPLEASEEGLAGLEAFFVGLRSWLGTRGRGGCMLINLMAEDGGGTPGITGRTRAYRARIRAAFVDALLRAEAAGEVKPGLATSRADLLVGIVLGLNIAARGGADRAEVQRLVDGALTQVRAWELP